MPTQNFDDFEIKIKLVVDFFFSEETLDTFEYQDNCFW